MPSEKRLVPVTETDVTTHVLAAPLHGWKIVNHHYRPAFVGSAFEHYVVGSHHKLDAALAPYVRVAMTGFHFAVRALAVLDGVTWRPTYRLLRVEVPAGATVSTDGVGYAATELRVVSDETASVATLLTGVLARRKRYSLPASLVALLKTTGGDSVNNDDDVAFINYVGGVETSDGDAPTKMEMRQGGRCRHKAWYTGTYQRNRKLSFVTKTAHSTTVYENGQYVPPYRKPTEDWEARIDRHEWYESIDGLW
jgi:hypothetical protein